MLLRLVNNQELLADLLFSPKQSLNSRLIQGAELETADSMTPFDVAVRILDNQLRSLMWIDEKVRIPNCAYDNLLGS
jgi:nuclear pore complex protein Nup62